MEANADRGVRIGTAGWAIPRAYAPEFPPEGSSLERYGARLLAAEINVTFHRMPKPGTFVRWAEEATDGFLFAVKMPRRITHDQRLRDATELVDSFLYGVRYLGTKLGPLLIQLPPSLAYDPAAEEFFHLLRARHDGTIVCEPRHRSWFEGEPDAMFVRHRVSRVAADPIRHECGASPGGWSEIAYYRMHGSPRIYRSAYGSERLFDLAARLSSSQAAERWCIFDNTASGAALRDALDLMCLC